METVTHEDERPRGILSDADRSFLRAPNEYSRQASHARQNAIQERIRNALLDFTILYEALYGPVDEQIRGVRGDWEGSPVYDFEDEELRAGLRDAIAFSLDLAGGGHLVTDTGTGPNTATAEDLLLHAFKRLGQKFGLYVHGYDLDVQSEKIPYADLLNRLENEEDVPAEQLVWAVESGMLENVDAEAVNELLQDELRRQLFEGDEDADN